MQNKPAAAFKEVRPRAVSAEQNGVFELTPACLGKEQSI